MKPSSTDLRLEPPPKGEDDLAKAAAVTGDFSSGLSPSPDRIPPPAAAADLGLIVGGMGVLGSGEESMPAFGVDGGSSRAS